MRHAAMRPGFGNAASMISRVRQSARLFPVSAWLCFRARQAICERVTKQDRVHARAGRDDVAGSRLNIE